jgi:hypothetical protein
MSQVHDMDAAARRLHAVAAVVGNALDPIVAYHRPDVWQGGRAARFGQELVDHRLLLRAAADQLVADARLLAARADLLRAIQALAP